MSNDATIEITDPAFARRFANLLIGARRRDCFSHRHLARRSSDAFSRAELKAFESGTRTFSPQVVDDLCALYAVDLVAILPARLTIEVVGAELRTGGLSRRFEDGDIASMLTTYLELVRELRCQARAAAVPLRRDDVLALGRHVGQPGEWVVERLAALMGATRTRRTAMTSAFASGAAIIGLVGGVAASDRTTSDDETVPRPAPTTTVWAASPSEAPRVQHAPPTTAPVVVGPVAVPASTDAPAASTDARAASSAPETVPRVAVSEAPPAPAPDVELVAVPALPAPATTAPAPVRPPTSDVAPPATSLAEPPAPSEDATEEAAPPIAVDAVVEIGLPPVPGLDGTTTTVEGLVVELGSPPVPIAAPNDAMG